MDIAEGSIVTSAMARASPVVPKGYTAVEVRLASSADSLTIGDTVTLSSATMFSEATPETVPDMDAVSLRELCTGAILTAKPSRNADGDTLAVFAMPPHERQPYCRPKNTARSSPSSVRNGIPKRIRSTIMRNI